MADEPSPAPAPREIDEVEARAVKRALRRLRGERVRAFRAGGVEHRVELVEVGRRALLIARAPGMPTLLLAAYRGKDDEREGAAALAADYAARLADELALGGAAPRLCRPVAAADLEEPTEEGDGGTARPDRAAAGVG